MSKKFLSDKINVTITALFFHSQAPANHSLIFNLQFLYKLKHMVDPSKIMCGIFHFRFRLIFIKVYISVQQKV